MATVSKWTPFGVALNLTATAGTVTRKSATQFTVVVNVSWEVYYDGAQTNYGMTATSGGVTSTISAFDGTKRSSGSGSFTGTYSISGNGAATKTISVTFKNFNTDNGDSATRALSLSVSVPAWTSYTITYNANGGSGAPSSQTKWKDQTLTLSSTKPTRNGYSFLGWSTSSTATSATYSAGGSYTANAAATLYAVWKANTYTVKYNANGGSGAPANQTKTYGKALTLSSTIPARTNYIFKGWATSATATSATYAAGGTYTANAAVTLYAVWEVAYVKPRISNVEVIRCDAEGTASDEGMYGLVMFDWGCDLEVASMIIRWKLATATDWSGISVDVSGTSGTVSHVIGDGDLSIESSYDIHITVADSSGTSYATDTLASMVLPIDALAGGTGVAFGKVAELEGVAEFEFKAQFNSPVYGKALGLDQLPEIPESDDFNNYLETGCWSVRTNAIAATIANMPPNLARAGRLEVWSSTGEGVRSEQWSYLRQRYIPYNSANAVWERDVTRGEDNSWTYYDWYRTSLTPTAADKVYHEQKILWSGGMYMTSGHTIELAEAVSAQPHGIVLVFCRYSSSTIQNYHFNTHFVPKEQIAAHAGCGHLFLLSSDGTFGLFGSKYLYIGDTYITGNDANSTSGTGTCGITYNNGGFVLRYVIGV